MFPLPSAWTPEVGLSSKAGILKLWDTSVPIISGTYTDAVCSSLLHHGPGEIVSVAGKDRNIGFDEYISTWIVGYIGDISVDIFT